VIGWLMPDHGNTGQGLTEFTIVMPVFLLLLVGMLEFGLAFGDRLTIGDATREGARIGAALATGSTTPCTGDPAGVDTAVVAGVENLLQSAGSGIDLSHVNSIEIYKADANGNPISGDVNTWVYAPGTGPDADPGPGTDILDFSPTTVAWHACDRNNGAADPDSIGVRIDYAYHLRTPLAALMAIFGGSQPGTIDMVDSTVMALNPTS
jgi:TadE-like protein